MALPDTKKREAFAREYALSGNASSAAKKAGVPAASAHSMGYKWLRSPAVIELIRQEVDSRMRELAPTAVSVINEVMSDPEVAPQVRLSAARDILDRMGWVPPKRIAVETNLKKKSLYEFTRQELELIASGELMP